MGENVLSRNLPQNFPWTKPHRSTLPAPSWVQMSGHWEAATAPRRSPSCPGAFPELYFRRICRMNTVLSSCRRSRLGTDREGFARAMLISETNFPTRAAAAFRFRLGPQTVAPSSISACREVTGFFRMNGGKKPDAGFHGGQIDREGSRRRGEKTATLPSTAGTGRSKGNGARQRPQYTRRYRAAPEPASDSPGNWPL